MFDEENFSRDFHIFLHNFLFFPRFSPHSFFNEIFVYPISQNFVFFFAKQIEAKIFAFFVSERNAEKSEIFGANFFFCNKCEFFKNDFSF